MSARRIARRTTVVPVLLAALAAAVLAGCSDNGPEPSPEAAADAAVEAAATPEAGGRAPDGSAPDGSGGGCEDMGRSYEDGERVERDDPCLSCVCDQGAVSCIGLIPCPAPDGG